MTELKTHCKWGHKFTENNTAYRKITLRGVGYILRTCKLCESRRRRQKYRSRPEFREYEHKRSKDRYQRLKQERFFQKLGVVLDLHYQLTNHHLAIPTCQALPDPCTDSSLQS